jgi:hypothetical protein
MQVDATAATHVDPLVWLDVFAADLLDRYEVGRLRLGDRKCRDCHQ